jgi:Cu-Zn family superoxide dismutase
MGNKSSTSSSSLPIHAVCVLQNKRGEQAGKVHFHQISKDETIIHCVINDPNVSAGYHGIHIHEYGEVTKFCETLGGHYNPYNQRHGGPGDYERHVGDLGNIYINFLGVGSLTIKDSLIKLKGPHNICGRSVVLHSRKDDLGKNNTLVSQTTGDSGSRILCGIIGYSKSEPTLH